jgi:hypothetical protein
MMASNGIRSGTVIIVVAGAVLTYASVKGKGISNTLRTLFSGGNPADTPGDASNASGIGEVSGDSGGFSVSPGVSGGLSGTAASNRRIGQVMAAARGWVGNQWTALDALLTQESGWDSEAVNPTSHAGGVGQANPYTKMPRIAWPKRLGGGGSVVAQLIWTYDYITRVYGTPEKAEQHEKSEGWY